jgi:hypothetical protein
MVALRADPFITRHTFCNIFDHWSIFAEPTLRTTDGAMRTAAPWAR